MNTASSFLEGYRKQLESQIERVKASINDFKDDDLNKNLGSDWGVGAIIEHMNLSFESYISPMGAAISRGVPEKGGQPKRTLVGNFIYKAAGPGGNAPVPPGFLPTGIRSKNDIDRYFQNCEKILQLFEQARGKDLGANKFANPMIKFLKMNLADGFSIAVHHNERHVRQIEERAPLIKEN